MKKVDKRGEFAIVIALLFFLSFPEVYSATSLECSYNTIDDCTSFYSQYELGVIRVCSVTSCQVNTTVSLGLYFDNTDNETEMAIDVYANDSQWPDTKIDISTGIFNNAFDSLFDCCYSYDQGTATDCNIGIEECPWVEEGSCDCGPGSEGYLCSNSSTTVNQTACIHSSNANDKYMSFNLTFNTTYDYGCLRFNLTRCWGESGSFLGCARGNGTALTQYQNYRLVPDSSDCVQVGGSRVELWSPGNGNSLYNASSMFRFSCMFSDLDNEMNSMTLWSNFSGTWAANKSYVPSDEVNGNTNNVSFIVPIPGDNKDFKWNCKAVNNESQDIWAYSNYTMTIESDYPPNVTMLDPSGSKYVQSGGFSVVCNTSDDYKVANLSLWHNASGSLQRNQTVTVNAAEANITFNLTGMPPGSYLVSCKAFDNASQSSNRTGYVYYVSNPPVVTYTTSNNISFSFRRISLRAALDSYFPLDNATLYTNISGLWQANQTIAFTTQTSANLTFNITPVPNGTFIWNVLAVNNGSENAWASANRTFIIDPCSPSSEDDWNISDANCTIRSRNLTVAEDRNLNILQNSTLLIFNSSLWFKPQAGNASKISVQNATFLLNRTMINTTTPYHLESFNTTSGNVSLLNTSFDQIYLYYFNTSSLIVNCTFLNSRVFTFISSGNTIVHSSFFPDNDSTVAVKIGDLELSSNNNFSFNRIENMVETAGGPTALSATGSNNVLFNNTIRNIYSSSNGVIGISISGDNNLADSNLLTDIVSLAPAGSAYAIYSSSGNNVTIRNNVITNTTFYPAGDSAGILILNGNGPISKVNNNTVNVTNGTQLGIASWNSTVNNNTLVASLGWRGIRMILSRNAALDNNRVSVSSGEALLVEGSRNSVFANSSLTSGTGVACRMVQGSYNQVLWGSNCTSTTEGVEDITVESGPGISLIDVIAPTVRANASSGYEVLVLNSTFSNLTFDDDSDDSFRVQWYLDAHVSNQLGLPVESAAVEVFNNSLDSIYDLTTAVNGAVAIRNLTEYVLSDGSPPTAAYQTNYTFNISCDGYENTTYSRNLTSSAYLNFTLNDLRPKISFAATTTGNASAASQDWIFAEVSVTDVTQASISFLLYNTSGLVLNSSDTGSPFNTSKNFTGLSANQAYYFNVTVTDTVGNINSTETRSATLDSSAPVADYHSSAAANNSNLSQDWISVRITVSDLSPYNVTYYLHNASGLVNQTRKNSTSSGYDEINFTGLNSNKQYWFNVTVSDDAGNNASLGTRSVTLDTTVPGITLTSPADNGFSAATATFIFTLTETNPVACSLFTNFSGIWQANATNSSVLAGQNEFKVTGIPDGDYRWNARCNDSANNSGWAAANFTVIVDSTPPSINFSTDTLGNNSAVAQTWVYLNVTASDQNEANITFRLMNALCTVINSTTYGVGNRSINFTGLGEGAYRYNVTMKDRSGNENTTEKRWITLSLGSPVVQLLEPMNGSGVPSVNITFNVTAYDTNPASCVLYHNASGSWLQNQTIAWLSEQKASFAPIILTPGHLLWNVWCNDTLNNGNWYVANQTVTIDINRPAINNITAWSSSPGHFYQKNYSNNISYLYFRSGYDQYVTLSLNMTADNPDAAGMNETFGTATTNESDINPVNLGIWLETSDGNATSALWARSKGGLYGNATAIWTADSNPPTTTDNNTGEWYTNDVTLLLSSSDDLSGWNHSLSCSNDYLSNPCTPDTLTFTGLVAITCAANSACQKVLRYQSFDNVSNNESVRESAAIFIVKGSTVSGTNASSTNISDGSNIQGSNLSNATIKGCVITTSTVHNSILRFNGSYRYNCTVANSVVNDTNLTSSQVADSIIDPSVIIDSVITNSTVQDDTVSYSRVENTALCAGLDLYEAVVVDGILISGRIIAGGNAYYGPYSISEICAGSAPRVIGGMSIEPLYAKDSDPVTFIYTGSGIGWSASIAAAEMQELDSNGTNLSLHDNGLQPDSVAGDGVYTAAYSITSDSVVADGNKSIELNVSDNLNNRWAVTATVVLDNTVPSGFIVIEPISQPGWENASGEYTGSATVILNTTYNDSNGVEACRYYEVAWTDWESCVQQRAWVLTEEDGLKTILYQVKDHAGNINQSNDTIYLNKTGSGLDITAPSAPVIIDDGNWTNSTDTLHVRWVNATDRESELLHIALTYEYRIYDQGAYLFDWTETSDSDVTASGLTLTSGANYTWEVRAVNSVGLRSEIAYSDGIIPDHVTPLAPTVASLSHPSQGSWYNNNTASFNWSSSDALSGIGAFSYVLDSAADTDPDTVPEGTLGNLEGENSTLFQNAPDGVSYFHVRAQDKAANWGNPAHHTINVDTSAPTTPQMLVMSQYINTTEANFSWSASQDPHSGIATYYLQVSNSSLFETLLFEGWVGNVTNDTVTVPVAAEYFARVRSQNGAGLNSSYSDQVSTILDVIAPKLWFYKPNGTVISTTVIIVMETDEDATCEYLDLESTDEYHNFTFTGSTLHETRVSNLNLTNYSYGLRCKDAVNNQNSTTISFTVTDDEPDSISFLSNASGFTDTIIDFNVSVTGGGIGLGEIRKSDTNLSIGGYTTDYTLDDRGSGRYRISFRAPKDSGNYTLVFTAMDASASTTAEIKDSSLTMSYDSSGLDPVSGSNMAYDRTTASFGVASDSSDTTITSSETTLTVRANTADGKVYLFATKPSSVENREDLFRMKTFQDQILPSFGYQLDKANYLIRTQLGYGDIYIRSPTDTAKEFSPGSYNLVIKNKDTEAGRTVVEVTS
ncbi:MAG: choice-of-anchor X domain-containing protein [Nanoarchaeota archaeon]